MMMWSNDRSYNGARVLFRFLVLKAQINLWPTEPRMDCQMSHTFGAHGKRWGSKDFLEIEIYLGLILGYLPKIAQKCQFGQLPKTYQNRRREQYKPIERGQTGSD